MGGRRRQLSGSPAVVGVADHNGWAVLVTVAAINGRPAVVDRRQVELVEQGVPSQPYHHETLAMPDEESERLLRTVRRSIERCTAQALDCLSADLRPHCRVSALAIRQPPLAMLPATVADVHQSYQVTCRADGMLYHQSICAAADARDWAVTLHPRGKEMAMAADALRTSTAEVERFLDDLRTVLRPPWTAEHRRACAAAIARLKAELPRLSIDGVSRR